MIAGTPSCLQPRTEDDAALAAADHHHVGLLGEAERALFVLPCLEPALAVLVGAVLDALGTVRRRFFSSKPLSSCIVVSSVHALPPISRKWPRPRPVAVSNVNQPSVTPSASLPSP